MADTLQTLLNAIPTAAEGDVINPVYHNSLRAALHALAGQLGSSPGPATLAYPPQFAAHEGGPNWVMANGVAAKDQSNNAKGWFALHLPHGSRLQSLTVTGRRIGNVASFSVKLLRLTVEDGNNVVLINLLLRSAPDPFRVTQTVNVPGAGPAALDEYRLVDNNRYTYLVTATLLDAADLVQIHGIQVSYTQP